MKNGTRVNVTLGNGNEVAGNLVKTFKNGKVRVELESGEMETFDAVHVHERKAGRKSLAQSMSPDDLQADIEDIMGQLGKAKNEDDKKRLRRMLRRRGHTGGLGIRKPKAE